MRLFAFDLDGTSIVEHKYVSAKNKAAFKRLHEKGIILVPSTGRIRGYLPQDVLDLSGIRYLITSNGASIYDLKEKVQIYKDLLNAETALKVQQILDEYEVYCEYYHNGGVLKEEKHHPVNFEKIGIPKEKQFFLMKDYTIVKSYMEELKNGLCPEKITLPHVKEEIYENLYNDLIKLDGICITSSVKGNMEINSDICSKGRALKYLADYLGIKREDVAAIGDNGNDVKMLEFAGISFAMGNASEDALAAAKYVTLKCEEDGVAAAIDRILNNDI